MGRSRRLCGRHRRPTRLRRRWIAACAGALAITLLSACGDDEQFTIATAPAASLPALRPLHAPRGTQPGIFDADGRQVILRGMNLNSLGDYYQANPNYGPVLPVTDADFSRMASHGFDVVRLIVSWSALEPERNQISADYIDRVRSAVAAAKAHGIYVILDMHQDAWGKYINSPPGTMCSVGRDPAIGWDGAPQWATLTDGKSTCRAQGVRELSPAVVAAFENFYADRDGIQTQLVDTWAALVRAFAREPAVAGYDLLNEPHFGGSLSGEETAPKLAAYYARAIAAIRAAEQDAGGFSHIVFFEPIVLWPNPGNAPAADFTTDTNIVYAPHNYAESISIIPLSIEQSFAQAAGEAAGYDTTFWIGEYGWFGDPPANKPKVVRYAREEDRRLVGGVWWQWKQACGDPHSLGRDGGTPPPELIHFDRSQCPGDIDLGPIPEWDVVLSRPYPRAAPGRLLSLDSDGDARTAHLTGDASGAAVAATLDLWVPDRGRGEPSVQGTGIGPAHIISVPNGYRVLVDVSGTYEVVIQ